MKLTTTCPAKITSPAPSAGFMAATGLGPNEPCGLRVDVYLTPDMPRGVPLTLRCPRGHEFVAGVRINED